MHIQTIEHQPDRSPPDKKATQAASLRNFYYLRAVVAAVWVALAFTLGAHVALWGMALLVSYPAWDALANWLDASRNGGMSRNRPQALNVVVSAVTAVSVLVMLHDMRSVLTIFGVWAILAGLLQLATGVARWKAYGAQWAMILSGAQSALAGGLFIARSFGSTIPSVVDVAPYAALGAFYFAVSALWLTFRRASAASTAAGSGG